MAKKIEREVVKASSAKKETKKAKAPTREAKAEEGRAKSFGEFSLH